MTTSAKSALGVTLSRNGNLVAELTKLNGPELSLESIDVTSHDSADDFKEFIGGLLDGGEVSIEGNFVSSDSNGQIGLQTDMLAKTLQTFVITFPTSITATWTFSALVTKFKATDFDMGKQMSFSATLKISGKPVLAITASADITSFSIAATSGALSPLPTFAGSTYDYAVIAATGDTFVNVTVTDASASTITAVALGVTWNLTTGVASGNILITDAAVTDLVVTVTDSGKVPKVYTFHIARP